MVEAVARHGYAGTTLRELVAIAGVSKSTFYDHFESKEECFLATFDEIMGELGKRVGEAYRGPPGDYRERLLTSLGLFMQVAAEQPAAAALAAVDSLTLGPAGVEHRERASRAYEVLITQSLEQSPTKREVPATTARAVVGGIRGVAYRRLREGEERKLPGLVEDLVDWALAYQEADSEATKRAIEAAGLPAPPPPPRPEDYIDWEEPPDSKISRARLSQRERIVRGSAQVVVARGYGALSIPAISAAAGTSNQTFYENFKDKREAFLAAFELLAADALSVTAAAMAATGNRPEAIGVGVRAVLEHIGANKLFARLAFFELPTAGPPALDRADEMLDSFTSFLEPGAAPRGVAGQVTPTIREAVGSGIWAVLQYEISHGRVAELPRLAPEITRLGIAALQE